MRIILWFNRDLRLQDNPALMAALENASKKNNQYAIFPIYIFDTSNPWPVKGAAGWWLHQSLTSLNLQLEKLGTKLTLFKGDPIEIIKDVLGKTKATGLYFSRAYDPHLSDIQSTLYHHCKNTGLECRRFAGQLLFEPETRLNKQAKPFQVFTPFFKKCLQDQQVIQANLSFNIGNKCSLLPIRLTGDKLADWKLLPTQPNWAKRFDQYWQPGEAGAHKALNQAIAHCIGDYNQNRDFPSVAGTSQLSPHLAFGEISPRLVWHNLSQQIGLEIALPFLRQLIWREFNYSLLYHWPHLPEQPFKSTFKQFPWKTNKRYLLAWQKGATGYPIVDAGMRQLWQTGWMHNRVRMIVASFLTKHLGLNWMYGARWFWDTLLDADLANNSAGWQWVAGSGADAAPYFRIFNPVLQGQKFDANGYYIKKWIPELSGLPNNYIHQPWTAPEEAVKTAGIILGKTYPMPIVDHKIARSQALEAYHAMKIRNGQ